MLRRASLVLPFALAACSSGDEVSPLLEVTAPDRGTTSEAREITVTGHVADDAGAVRVTVNGLAADVAADGAFALTFAVPEGIEVIETIATDAAGNQARDVRAVLAGALVPTSTPVDDALAARIGPDAFAVIADVVASTVETMDLAATIGGDEPLVSLGGTCYRADVYLSDVAMGDVALSLVPVEGAIDAAVAVTDLEIRLRASYRHDCEDDVGAIVVRADRVALAGTLGLAITEGTLASSIEGVQVELEGLGLDVEYIPDDILGLVEAAVEALAPTVMEAVMTDTVPGLVDETIADLTGRSYAVDLLDRTIAVSAAPTTVAIDGRGAFVAMRADAQVSGDDDGVYLSTPAAASPAILGPDGGLAIAIADDTVNQMFAGLWASGVLEHDLELPAGDPLQLLLGGETRRVRLSLSLPPTAAIDGSGDLRLTIGDAILRCEDEAGAEVVTIALSFSTTLGATAAADGAVTLRLGEPEAWAQVLSRSERLDLDITGENVEVLFHGLYDVLSAHANHALEALPIPALAGVTLDAPTLESRDGFVVLHTLLAR